MATVVPSELTLLQRIQHTLGLRAVTSDDELLRLVENRLPVNVLSALKKHGISDDEIYRLVIPRRTLAHRKSRREPLTQDESDRVVRLARIRALAGQVFGDPNKAAAWLHQSKHRFDGRTPMDMLTTEAGARLVEEMLYQIDYGLFA